jgi:dihydrodipicolinate synthase/N-acetylneuraminate lyase
MNFEWKGVFPALLTPFTQDDQLDIPLLKKTCKHKWMQVLAASSLVARLAKPAP